MVVSNCFRVVAADLGQLFLDALGCQLVELVRWSVKNRKGVRRVIVVVAFVVRAERQMYFELLLCL